MTPPSLIVHAGLVQLTTDLVSGRVTQRTWGHKKAALVVDSVYHDVEWINTVDWVIWCAVHAIDFRTVLWPELDEFEYEWRGMRSDPRNYARITRISRTSGALFAPLLQARVS